MVPSYVAFMANCRRWIDNLFDRRRSGAARGTTDLTTIDGIARDLFSKTSADDLKYLCDVPRHRMIKYHFTTGMYVRNFYGLWDEEHPLTKDGAHPDDVSMEILYRVWDFANGNTDDGHATVAIGSDDAKTPRAVDKTVLG